MLHELRRGLRVVVTRAELTHMVVSPAINVAIDCQSHTEPISNLHLLGLPLDLLHAVRRQELAKGARAPEKQTPRVVRDRRTKTAGGYVAHRNVRYLVDQCQCVGLVSRSIAQLSRLIFARRVDQARVGHDEGVVVTAGDLLRAVCEVGHNGWADYIQVRRVNLTKSQLTSFIRAADKDSP